MKNTNLLLFLFSLLLAQCTFSGKEATAPELPDIAVNAADFDTIYKGKEVNLFNLINKNGMVVQVCNYGARIVSILLPGDDGGYRAVVLGYKTIGEYLNDPMNQGCVVGRYANRIAKGRFELDGVAFQLEINNGENTLHSGSSTYSKVVWDVYHSGDSVFMHYVSPHMDGGFPGELRVTVAYVLTDSNTLELTYEAETSAKTVINLTNHTYFNLAGEGSGDVSNQYIKIFGDFITPVNSQMIPTGDLMPVDNTPFDLRSEVKIGKMIEGTHEQLIFGKGYDHNWVLNKEIPGTLSLAASCRDVGTGFQLNVYTTEPGIQFYTGNFMNGTVSGKSGGLYAARNGFALEAQHFPDSPNHHNFPSTVLEPGNKYFQKTVLEFNF